MLNRKFGKTLVQAFGASIGAPGDTSTINLRYVSLEWTLKNVFRTGNKTMIAADMSYEHKGYAKYVKIANLFGWDAIGDFWKSVNVDYENGISYSANSDPTDSRIERMSKAARVDLRPLLHFWGAPPLNATNERNSINAAALPPSGAVYRRLKYYQSHHGEWPRSNCHWLRHFQYRREARGSRLVRCRSHAQHPRHAHPPGQRGVRRLWQRHCGGHPQPNRGLPRFDRPPSSSSATA